MARVQVRYIVRDVPAAIAFYTRHLGFKLEMHPGPTFAMLSRGELRLVLSLPNPSAGGGQPMPDGRQQEPGGWNRFAVYLDDLVTGVGGKQVIVEDPSGNPVELFQPTIPAARLGS